MTMVKEARCLVVLAQAWPVQDRGGAIAVYASLVQYEAYFDTVYFLCINELDYPRELEARFPRTVFLWMPRKQRSKLTRFLRSLLSLRPAVVDGMSGQKLISGIATRIASFERTPQIGIIEENVPAANIRELRRRFPGTRWGVRFHDDLGTAFRRFASVGQWYERLAWGWELLRMEGLEAHVIRDAEFRWAITSEDRARFERRYAVPFQGVFGVSIDFQRYEGLSPGDQDTIVYVGSADHRKSDGLTVFVRDHWPLLKKHAPSLRFILAGRGTEVFSNPAMDIEGLGWIEDDREVIALGQYFLNPQISGSGVKLKSLVAMAAGRVLLTTENGSLGVGGQPGRHYILYSSPTDLLASLVQCRKDAGFLRGVRDAARCHVQSHFSEGALAQKVQPLLEQELRQSRAG